MSEVSASLKDRFATFLRSPSRDDLLKIFDTALGEESYLDYKEDWPATEKMAKHVIGMANSGGGLIVIGVSELPDGTHDLVGLNKLKDKTDIYNIWSNILPDALIKSALVLDFDYTNSVSEANVHGKVFQAVLVQDSPQQIPFLAVTSRQDIKNDVVYVRRGPSTVAADGQELEDVINRRLSTLSSTQGTVELTEHLSHLRALYGEIRRFYYKGGVLESMATLYGATYRAMQGKKVSNPVYPEEDFEGFVVRMIGRKKEVIEELLEVNE